MIYGILLAAGASSRMGRPKQLLDWHGQPLVRHVVRQAQASRLDGLVVVLGAHAEEVRAALEGETGDRRQETGVTDEGPSTLDSRHASLVMNSNYAAGQASSLRAGLATLPPEAEAAVVLLVDQPLVTPGLIDSLIEAYRRAGGAYNVVIPRYDGRRGNPVLLGRALFGELMALEGDAGARGLLQRYGERVLWLDVHDPAVVTDMDTWEEYQRVRSRQ